MLNSNWLAKLMRRLSPPAKSRRSSRRRVSPACGVERLEQRRLLSGTAVLSGSTLTVTGSDLDNTISITNGANLAVTIDGVTSTFTSSSVTAINITAMGGNDSVTINSLQAGATLQVDGGDGNDTLVVASTVTNATVLLGGNGNDALTGGAGNDTLTGGAGNDTLTGGAGNDTYMFNTDLALGSDTINEASGGTDTLDFSATTTRAVVVDLSNAAAQVVNAGLTLTLSSATTIENATGGALNDTLTGNTLNNVLTGGLGNDTLAGGAGNDTYAFNTNLALGSDTINEAVGGVDTLDFSTTTTRTVAVDLSNAAAQVVNAGLTLTLSSGTTMENVIGGTVGNTLTGNSLNNTFTGGVGNDTYVFNTDLALGSDTINEAAGGVDTLDFSGTTTRAAAVDLSNAAAQVVNAGLTLTLSSATTIENATGGAFNDTLTGNTLNNTLTGGAGNDTLTGGAGNDTYVFNTNLALGSDTINEAGGGTDTLDFSATTTRTVAVDLSNAAAQVVNAGLTLTLSSGSTVENVIGGTVGNTLTGNSLNNTLTGGAGNDTYIFNTSLALGSDTINESGSGIDTLDFSATTTRTVAVDLSNAAAQVVNAGLTLTLSSGSTVENVIGGTVGNTLTGNSLNNVLTGGAGNDTLTGGLGNDTLTGGAGNDTYAFNTDLALGSDTINEAGGGTDTLDFSATTTRTVTVDLSNAAAQVVNAGLTLTLSANNTIENATSGALNDTLTGNSLNNVLTGGAGNDTYVLNTNLALGSDTINEAGGGTDTLDFSATTTRSVAVDLSNAAAQVVNAGLTLTLSSGSVMENVIGGALNDTLSGNALNNVLTGGAGDDTLTGGAGNDTYLFDTDLSLGSDLVDESGGGIDTLNFSGTTTRAVAVDLSNATAQYVNAGLTLTLLSSDSAMENVVGGADGNTLIGNSLNNTFTGGAGNDTYAFNTDLASGSDTIIETGSGIDTLDFSQTLTQAVVVDLSNAAAQVVNAGLTLTLSSGSTIESVIGGTAGNTLTGNTLNNVLTGGAGNDTLTGGAGNDTYVFNTDLALGSDTINESGGGSDTLDFSGTTTRAVAVDLSNAAAQVVNAGLTLTLSSGSTMENVIGGELDDTLTGNTLDNTLTGGAGDDTLTGGAGNDTYAFDTDPITGLGSDTINESGGGVDTLDFSGTTTRTVTVDLSNAAAQMVNNSLTLTLSAGNTIENVIGGSLNDTLTGNSLNNTLAGGLGNDTYVLDTDLAAGSDTINEAAGGTDTLDFSDTTTRSVVVDLSNAAAQVVNAGLTLTLTSGNTIEKVIGGALDDTLTGNSLDNTLTGGTGNDTYVFDTDLALGSDTIVESGGGTDTLDFSGTTTRSVVIDLSDSGEQVVNAGLALTLSSSNTMENAIGGTLGDTLTGNSRNNVLTGGAGNDTYVFNTNQALGSDTINEAGGGIDTLDFSETFTRAVVVDLSNAGAQVVNSGLTLTLSSGVTIENVIGGSLNDTLTGNSLNNTLTGELGNDTYVFDTDLALGSDTINEAAGGTDTLDFSGTTTRTVTVDLSNAAAQVVNAGLTLTLSSGATIENVNGGALNDTLTGNALNNKFTGGAGNDTYLFDTDLALGSDTIIETGGGIDLLDFSATTTRNVAVKLSNAGSQVVNAGLTLTLSAGNTIENVTGGTLDDTLTGNSLDNVLTGGAGNDTYVFDTDTDLGSDTINEAGGGIDTLDFSGTYARAVTVDLSNAAAQAVNDGLTLTLSAGNTIENVVGGAGGNTLTGNSLNNTFTGGSGADTFLFDTDLSLGSDTIASVGSGVDTIDFSGTTTRNITVNLSNTAAQVVNAGLTLTISAGSLVENVIGGALNDTLAGNSLNNTLTGGAGNDTYVYDVDLYQASDTIDETGGGIDTLDFSGTTTKNVNVDLSDDTSQYVSSNLTLTLSSDTAMENVIGGSLNDKLTGNSLNNVLTGGAGNDTYVFNTDLGSGSDTINEAGGGTDTLNFSGTTTRSVAVDLSNAAAQVVNAGLTLTLSAGNTMENVIGGALNDTLTGNSLNNSLTGGLGNDTYIFDTDLALGSDVVSEAGSGTDTLDFSGTTTRTVTVDLSKISAQVVNAGLTLTLSSGSTMENVTGGALNDTLIGNSLANVLTGGAGNDALTGGAGNDTYVFDTDLALGSDTINETGGGNDSLDFGATTTRSVAIDLSVATAQVVNAGLTLTLSAGNTLENVTGGALNDTITGNAQANVLAGGAGNDTYNFDADLALGSDTINESGGGTDTLNFGATTTKTVTVDLSSLTSQQVNLGLTLTLSSGDAIENVIGGALNDTLTGNSLNNVLTGGAGNDTYVFNTDLALGSDTINEAGGGIDTLDFSATTTRAVAVDLSNAAAQVVNAGLTLTLSSGTTMENATGGALNDTLVGNTLNNTLTGGGGDDALTGGAGNDTYLFDTDLALGSDTINESGGASDTLSFSGTTTRNVTVDLSNAAAQVVNDGLTLTLSSGVAMENVIGGALNDTLIGNSLNNVFTGGAGNDTYVFDTDLASGSDTINESGGGTDTLDFSGTTTRNVVINLSTPTAQVVNAGLTLNLSSASTIENVIGGDLNDTLTGNTLGNTLTGGAGNDKLTGGAGNDTYLFDTDLTLGSDTIVESGGGIDTLNFSGTTTRAVIVDLSNAAAQVVNAGLTLTLSAGNTMENVIGGGLDDRLIGNTLANVLYGGAGNDTLIGGAGNNVLIGGTGSDALTGGANEDLMLGADYTGGTDAKSLILLRNEWASTTAFDTRIAHLLGTLIGGANGSTLLTSLTVIEDGAVDTLTGGSGRDWYLNNAEGSVVENHDSVTDADLDSVFEEINTWL